MTASWQLVLLLGRARRARHRVDGAGVRRDRRRPLVRRAAAAWSPACSPRATPPASSSSCRWSPGSPQQPRLAHGGTGRSPAARSPSCRSSLFLLRDYPADLGLPPYGGDRDRHATGSHRQRGAASRVDGSARRGPDPAVLVAGRRLRDLRRDDQRAGRHALHPGGARPRHADDDGRRGCSRWSACSTSSARSRPAGSPTGSTRACCWPATTRCAGCRCWSVPAVRRLAAPEHAGVRRLLRPRLGGDRPADGRAVPAVLRRRRPGRVRLGVRRRTSSVPRSRPPPPA